MYDLYLPVDPTTGPCDADVSGVLDVLFAYDCELADVLEVQGEYYVVRVLYPWPLNTLRDTRNWQDGFAPLACVNLN